MSPYIPTSVIFISLSREKVGIPYLLPQLTRVWGSSIKNFLVREEKVNSSMFYVPLMHYVQKFTKVSLMRREMEKVAIANITTLILMSKMTPK